MLQVMTNKHGKITHHEYRQRYDDYFQAAKHKMRMIWQYLINKSRNNISAGQLHGGKNSARKLFI